MTEITLETYERAIESLSTRNHELILENRWLKQRVEALARQQVAALQDRSRFVDAVQHVSRS